MDAATLRWIIIIIGVIILGAIFLFGNPEKKRKPRASRRAAGMQRREPTLEKSAEDPGPVDTSDESGQGELPIDREISPTEKAPAREQASSAPAPEKIVTLFLLARDNHVISGAELLEAALKTGMEFGEMNIFHRTVDGSDQPVFSLANAVKPGSFEKDAWNTFETGGLALFMTLPGPLLALDAWEVMLTNARRMAEILHAEIEDGDHEPLTRQKEAQTREEMRNYDRGRARQTLT